MFPAADWERRYQGKDELAKDFTNFKGPGWYQNGKDFALITEVDRGSAYHVMVWNNRDPRPELRNLANMEFHS